jgi:hypothetical protein
MVPKPFAARENRSCLELWAVTSDLQYSGYKIPLVDPEPSVEQTVEIVQLIGGRIGTHMLLWAVS